jgi:ATP-dependent Clp protease ATP-binding subunit ClpA
MFERFTTGARQTVVEAQQVARDLGDRQIGTAHLVVALASADDPAARALAAHGADRRTLLDRFDTPDAAGDDLDAAALASLGIDLDAVRRSADATFGAGALDATGAGRRGPAGRPPRHVPFTAEAKKTLEVALREAVRLGHKRIEAGHVLLAVLRLRDSAGHALLLRCGVDPTALTAEVERDLAERAAA